MAQRDPIDLHFFFNPPDSPSPPIASPPLPHHPMPKENHAAPVCYTARPAVTPPIIYPPLFNFEPSISSFSWPLPPLAVPELPILDSYKEAPSPSRPLGSTTPLGPHLPSFPLLLRILTIIVSLEATVVVDLPFLVSPAPRDPWNGFLVSLPCS
jgi:hypothetical protein